MPNWGLGEDDPAPCTRCEAAERDAATRQAIADDRWAAIERLEAVVEHLREQNAMLMEELASADDAARVDARLTNGVLTVTCPKAPEAQPHKVQVRTA